MSSSPHPSRRDFLQAAGLSLMAWPLAGTLLSRPRTATAQSPPPPPPTPTPPPTTPALPPLNRFPRMMQDWLTAQVREAEARGNALRAAIKTRSDAEAFVKSVQERIRQSFGPAPEKTPLNARVMRVVERD